MVYTNINREVAMSVPPVSNHHVHPNMVFSMSKQEFANALSENTGILVIKFGATWCGPCKTIEPYVYDCFSRLPAEGVKIAVLDIDEDDSFELYGYLRTKKMVNGVPAILCYRRGNTNYIPDKVVVGADMNGLFEFFNACVQMLQ